MNTNRLPFVDIETTGLDENRHGAQILEFGCIIVDKNLDEIARYNAVVHASRVYLPTGSATHLSAEDFEDDRVFEMHKASGLMTECLLSQKYPAQIWEEIASFLREHDAIGAPMCGANVANFDRRWIRRHWPSVDSLFHYRNLDASFLRVAADVRGVTPPPKDDRHRTMPDCEAAIRLIRWGLGALHLEAITETARLGRGQK